MGYESDINTCTRRVKQNTWARLKTETREFMQNILTNLKHAAQKTNSIKFMIKLQK